MVWAMSRSKFTFHDPCEGLLPQVAEACARGWSSNTMMDRSVEMLNQIRLRPLQFLRTERGETNDEVEQPDGSFVARLPSMTLWIVDGDGEFCGKVSLRWKPGGEKLPPTCLGHIGYSIVEWKRNRGAASAGLAAILPFAKGVGLRWVDITVSIDNRASRRVAERNGGVVVAHDSRFDRQAILYRVALGGYKLPPDGFSVGETSA